MVRVCVAPNCKKYYERGSDITFHEFPVDLERRKQWVEAMNRVGFIPGKHSSLCSKHFEEKDYNIYAKNKRVLKKDAIPTIFNTSSSSSNVLSVSKLRETLYKKMTAFVHETVDDSNISTTGNLSYENEPNTFKRTDSSSPVSELLIKRHKSDYLSSTVSPDTTTEIYPTVPSLYLTSNIIDPAVIKREERIARRNSKKLVSELLKQTSGSVTQISNKKRKPNNAIAKLKENKVHINNNTNQHTQNNFVSKQVIPTQKITHRQFNKKPIAVRCTCCQIPASSINVNPNSTQIKTESKSGKTETHFDKKNTEPVKQPLLFENIDNYEQTIRAENIIKTENEENEDSSYSLEQVYVIGAPEHNENIKEENIDIKTEPVYIEDDSYNLDLLVKKEHDEIDIKEEPLFP